MSLSSTADIRSPRASRRPRYLAVTAVAAFVALLSLIPLGFIGFVAIDSGWDTVVSLVFRPKVFDLIINTVMLVAV
ncbi:MAG: iron ABC transporter permease, partial [Alphaproteobacteria bacterium]